MMKNNFFRDLGRSAMRMLLLGLPALAWTAPARAELMIFPTRVVLDNADRSAQVELVNRDTKTASYRINIIYRRMTETGELVEAATPPAGEQAADGMLYFTPRLVTLKPGESQIVRVMVRRPANLAPGEYRSHLQFDRLPDIEEASNIEVAAAARESTTASIRLTALVGASIPVIIRQGQTEAKVSLDNLAFVPAGAEAGPSLTFEMTRQGNRSVYGDISATYETPGGRTVELGNVSGVAVYVPNPVRRARLPLTLPAGVALKGGSIVLRYSLGVSEGGAVMAESRVAVP